MTKPNPPNSGEFIYPPSRAIKVAKEEFERRIARQNVLDWGIPAMDRRIVPPIPGDLITILGRPGMGKTMLLLYLCLHFDRRTAQMSLNSGAQNEIILYAGYETTVEEFVGILSGPLTGYTLEDIGRGKVDMKRMEAGLVKTLSNNLIVFGQSRENYNNPHPPTLANLVDAVNILRERYGLTVRALLVDYLQRIPGNGSGPRYSDRMDTVTENLEGLKTLAQRFSIPAFVAVQAKRDVDEYEGVKFPKMSDGQWTSSIEQTSDKVFSITMPVKYLPVGYDFDVGPHKYHVTENMLGVKMLKQRFGPVNNSDIWMLELDPTRLHVQPLAPSGPAEDEIM